MGCLAHFLCFYNFLFFWEMKTNNQKIYVRLNFLLTIVFPVISILQGNTTVFYIVYLYWWQELIASLLDRWYYKHKDNADPTVLANPLGARLFLLFVYFVFIVALFGVMSSWGNIHQMRINLLVFLFRDVLFNINLIGIVLNEWWLRQKMDGVRHHFYNPFSGRMMVMHISIIVGGFVSVFAMNHFPKLFSSDNIWLSVLVAMPFLLLKAFMIRRGEEEGLQK